MNERQIPRWAMAAVALVVLFGLGSLLYNSGYSSGMVTGLLATSGEGGAMNPYLLSRMGGGLHGGVSFFGGLLRIGFFLFFLAMIGRFFGFWREKMRWMHNGDGAAHDGQQAFSPHFRGMWEAHRAWHQAEQSAPAQAAAPVETPKAETPPVPPVEAK